MADVEFGEFAAADPRGSGRKERFQQLVNGAGALTSVALVVGLGVWGYRLAVRDVTGIPVIRAIEGPARIAPQVPGGQLAAHQGLSVNTIAAEGAAAAPPDRLRLAPRAPDLGDEARTMGELAASMEEVPSAEAATAGVDTTTASPAAEPQPLALVVLSADVPGVARSPRPMLRPAGFVPDAAAPVTVPDGGDAMAEAAAAAVAEALAGRTTAEEVAPEALPDGARLVQLGAFDSPETARAEWDRTAERFGTLMEGKERVIQEAESGGHTFYRLRVAGFEDVADARNFCVALLAEGANCVPAQVR